MISLSRARCAATLLASLALAGPATANIEVVGSKARFEWAPSAGPVNMYYVYEARNGGAASLKTFRLTPDYLVTGVVGDTIVLTVRAVSNTGALSQFSLPSEPVTFVGAQAPPPDDPPDDPPPSLPPAEGAAPTDFDGDGTADLLFQDDEEVTIFLIRNGSWVGQIGLTDLAPNAVVVGNGDYDADGYADLLTHDPVAGQLSLALAVDGTLTESASFPIAAGWNVIASADFDGDGRADIALRNGAIDVTEIWTMAGIELDHVAEMPASPSGATATGAGDIDGDGASELIWQSPSGLLAWHVERDGSAQEAFLHAGAGAGWALQGSCDLDRDGRSDLVLRSESSGELRALRFPNGVPTLNSFVGTGSTSRSVIAAGDYDGDGDCDLTLRAGSSTPSLTLLEGMQSSAQRSLWMPSSWKEVGVGEEGP
jgi:hypothetical protein